MKACWIATRGIILASLACMAARHAAGAQNAVRVQPQATAEDVLASLVHHSAAIFAGEVYAIRMPEERKGATDVDAASVAAGMKGGLPSSRPDAVEVEFRVDMGIRGASIGSNYVLSMPASTWEQAPPFTLHHRSVTFLRPADAAGFSGPVEGESDLPGLDLGVMPVDPSNQVDLSRLEQLVTRKTIRSATMLPPPNPSRTPAVTDVETAQGEETLVSGSREGRMPELRNAKVPFLALVRDVTVLSAAEDLHPNAAAASGSAK
jgi:hypothetical protein